MTQISQFRYLIFLNIHTHAAVMVHHETIHATLWVSSPKAQPDQLITIAMQIH